jgi:hypothetical protein
MFEVPEHVKTKAAERIWEKLTPYIDADTLKEKQTEISQTISDTFDDVVEIVKKGFGF